MPSMSGGGGGNLPFIVLRQSTTQAIASQASPTKLSFNVIADSEGWPNLPALPVTDLVIPYDGYILVVAHDLDFADNAITISTGVRKFGRELAAGAATRRMGDLKVGAGGAASNQTVSSWVEEIYLAAGATIAIIVAQVSGSSLNVAVNDVMFRYTKLGTRTLL